MILPSVAAFILTGVVAIGYATEVSHLRALAHPLFLFGIITIAIGFLLHKWQKTASLAYCRLCLASGDR